VTAARRWWRRSSRMRGRLHVEVRRRLWNRSSRLIERATVTGGGKVHNDGLEEVTVVGGRGKVAMQLTWKSKI
jgi:hypothetical protein